MALGTMKYQDPLHLLCEKQRPIERSTGEVVSAGKSQILVGSRRLRDSSDRSLMKQESLLNIEHMEVGTVEGLGK